jgi:RNase P subunit RPR2
MKPTDPHSWICLHCATKYGYNLNANSPWHFATCLKCGIKDAVTQQAQRA